MDKSTRFYEISSIILDFELPSTMLKLSISDFTNYNYESNVSSSIFITYVWFLIPPNVSYIVTTTKISV